MDKKKKMVSIVAGTLVIAMGIGFLAMLVPALGG